MPELVAAHPGWRLPGLGADGGGGGEAPAVAHEEMYWPAEAFRGPKIRLDLATPEDGAFARARRAAPPARAY